MRRSVARLVVVACALVAGMSCRTSEPPPPPPLVPQVSGTIDVPGLSAPVRIVRDRWGVPHVYAQRQSDLFFAQGFVQAQDRLFQMDLWRRSVQGRLSEVLGPNFLVRDAMTRRMQYRGDLDVEWASYGPDAKAIADAFVSGINAWIAIAIDRPPEEFALAGWKPEVWSSDDLLNRTDAFVASGDAIEEVRRLKLNQVVAEAIGRVGTAPFFTGLAAPMVRLKPATTDERVKPATTDEKAKPDTTRGPGGVRLQPDLEVPSAQMLRPESASSVSATRGGPLSLTEARRTYEHPSARYLVHLHAPGWNVIGATAPWLPGVVLGHNEQLAWGMTATAADTQDVYTEKVNPSNPHQVQYKGRWADTVVVKASIPVKGRAQPFEFDYELTPHGVVVASDRERHLVYTVRWSGTEPGGAAELAASTLDRARTPLEFRSALTHWKMPARRVVYAVTDGAVGFQDAALIPVRRAGEWIGWKTLDDLPHAFNPPGGSIVAKLAKPDPPAVDRAAVFAHVLAVTGPTRRRFNVGALVRPEGDAPVRAALAPSDWDRSAAMSAPGQSGSPDSPHFSDLAKLWEKGESVPLAFSDAAVQANTANTLTLTPRK